MGLAQRGESIKYEFFFPRHRACSNPNRLPSGKKLRESGVERFAKGNSVAFEISKDGHLLRIRSDGCDPVPVCLAWHFQGRLILIAWPRPSAEPPCRPDA